MTTKQTNGGLETKEDWGKELYRRGRAIFAGLDGERRNRDKGLAFLEAAAMAGNVDAQAERFYFMFAEEDWENLFGPEDKDPNVFRENKMKHVEQIKEWAEAGNPYAGLLWAAFLDGAEDDAEDDAVKKDAKRAAATRRKAMAALRRRAENDALDAYYYSRALEEELDDADADADVAKSEAWWKKIWNAVTRKNATAAEEAERWMLKSAEAGHARAVASWFGGYYIYKDRVDEKEAEKAFQLLEKAAVEQEDAVAAFFLGLSYLDGRFGKNDRQAGIDWVYKAATAGHANAMTMLGDLSAGVAFKKEGDKLSDENAIYWYRRAATSGDASANVKAGDAHRLGKGVEKNAELACFWYARAVEEGVAEGMRKLAWAFYYGEGVEKDLEKAEFYFRAAVDAGDGEAARDLGDLYALGDGFPKDAEKATAWFRKGAELGDDEAIARLATRLASGVEGEKSLAEESEWLRKRYENAAPGRGGAGLEAIEALARRLAEGGGEANRKEAELWRRCASEKEIVFWRRLATDGNPDAMWRLGCAYLDDESKENVEEGLRWLRQAAERGLSEAATRLGCERFQGENVEQDGEEALRWFRKAAELGNGEGAYLVANHYAEGCVVEQDFEEAFRWYRKAADLGFSKGLAAMGVMFLNDDFGRDVDKALGYLREAVDAGNADAAFLVGTLYEDDEFLEKDPSAALKWFRKAGEMGSVDAAVVLGELYRDGDDDGEFVKPDWNEAARWFSQAAETEEAGWCAYSLFLLYDQAGDCEEGATLEKDDAEALRALRRAAERTSDLIGPKAKLRLGEVYERGEFGVEANVDEARRFYREALATLDKISERAALAFADGGESDFVESEILEEAREKLLNSATTDVEAELREALEQATRRLER